MADKKKILEAIDNKDYNFLNSLEKEDMIFARYALAKYKSAGIDKEITYDKKQILGEVSNNLKPTIKLSLDNDGNILLVKHENVDFMTIYNNSHILLKEYKKVKNLEGIKYELCKLWMMKILIEQKFIYPSGIRSKLISTTKKQEYIKIKAFIMNDFKNFLRFVLMNEKNFNFNEFFNQTQFGVEVYKIDNRLIKAVKNFVI